MHPERRTFVSDPIDFFDGTDIEDPLQPVEASAYEEWWLRFQNLDQYDWNDPEFKRRNRGRYAYRPIPLSHGYFMLVSVHDHQRMQYHPDGSKKSWRAKIDYDDEGRITGVYARRSGRRSLGEPSAVYAHRELMRMLTSKRVTDHRNGWGLDNRRGLPKAPVNLANTRMNENNHNTARKNGTGLPTGVEVRGKGRYGGVIHKRYGKKVITVRSKIHWTDPKRAARWYMNQLKRRHKGRKEWIHDPRSVNYPIFPPLLESDMSDRSRKLRKRERSEVLEGVPF